MWTRIVATLGPASQSTESVSALVEAGVDIFRLNFSHGSHEEHRRTIETVRSVADQADLNVALLVDLCGPKVRIGKVQGDFITLQPGAQVILQPEPVLGSADRLSVSLATLCADVQLGAPILIDDGAIRLRAVERSADELFCTVEVGGPVRSGKGVNLPGTHIDAPSLTPKDLHDLAWVSSYDPDFVALSFVRSAADVVALRDAMAGLDFDARVIAKIEKPEAIEHLDEIIDVADAVLIARGDLGVEMNITRVSILQKEITRRCRRAARPVIVATQMLQSMIDAPSPTRAEASDVTNAVFDAVDAVMLSGETAIGNYPVESAQTMNSIVRETERYLHEHPPTCVQPLPTLQADTAVTSSVVTGAASVAEQLDACCVVVWTAAGVSATLLSRERMSRPLIAVTDHPKLCRQLTLCYGITAMVHERPPGSDQLALISEKLLLERRLAGPGDLIVVVAAAKGSRPGSTGAVYIHRILHARD